MLKQEDKRVLSIRLVAILTALTCLLGVAPQALAEDDSFDRMAASLVSYFKPLEGEIIAVDGGLATFNLGAKDGVKHGMRLNVTRKGAPFLHPITKEPYGSTESFIGKAEVTEVHPNTSNLRMISGETVPDDVARLSSAKVRTVFYQSQDVEWNLSEKYYWKLRDTKRFDIMDTAPGDASDFEIVSAAMDMEGEIVIILNSERKGDETLFKQRVLWALDGTQLYADEAMVTADMLADLRIGNELFTPRKSHTIMYELSASARIIESGDVNGDGKVEIVISTASEIDFFTAGNTLEHAFKGIKMKKRKGEYNLWIDLHDFDGDGADEIAVTSIRGDIVKSRIYKLKGKKFEVIWEGRVFLRVMRGVLYAQEHRRRMGYNGPVFPIDLSMKDPKYSGQALKLPPRVNIYDFSLIRTPKDDLAVIAYDQDGYLNLFDPDGAQLWRTQATYGGQIVKFKKDKTLSQDDTAEWYVSDRVQVSGRTGLAIRRIPLAKSAKGLGFRRSMLIGLRWMGPTLQESIMVDRIPGSIEDFTVVDNKVYVLVSPFLGIDTKKLLKGKSPLVNKLYVYSLKGQ